MNKWSFYESDFGVTRIMDNSPFPCFIEQKPDYKRERKAYYEWRSKKIKYSKFEDAFNLMLQFLWMQGKDVNEYYWKDGWLVKK